MSRYGMFLAAIGLVSLVGCNDFDPKTKPQSTVLRKWTQDIGEFKAEAKRAVSEGTPEYSDPILGPLEMYGPIVQDLSSMAVDQQLAMFQITHDRYPNSHKEFMDEIIYKNNLKLPVLPGKKVYQYDVANHQLVVVMPLRDAEGKVIAEPTAAATPDPAATPAAAAPATEPNATPAGAPAADPNTIKLPGGLSLPAPQTLPE
ncbi:MAG TPA: hypothetical protein VGE52_00535 [Pirellulales bacterium]